MRKYLHLAAVLATGMILGACAIGGASGFDLSGLGKLGELVEQVRAGTEKGIEKARDAVQEATTAYCGTVPLSIRRQARDIVNADPAGPQIVILCPGDPDFPGTS